MERNRHEKEGAEARGTGHKGKKGMQGMTGRTGSKGPEGKDWNGKEINGRKEILDREIKRGKEPNRKEM